MKFRKLDKQGVDLLRYSIDHLVNKYNIKIGYSVEELALDDWLSEQEYQKLRYITAYVRYNKKGVRNTVWHFQQFKVQEYGVVAILCKISRKFLDYFKEKKFVV